MTATRQAGLRSQGIRFLVLAIVAVLATLPGIARLSPVDRDESRYVQATKQMVETGDLIDIRFQEKARYNKPVGIYWMQVAAVTISGAGAEAPIWVYRCVSVLGIVLGVLAIAWTGTRLFGMDAGFIAGLVLAGLFSTAFEGRIAKTDAMLLGLVIVAQGALAQIYSAAKKGEENSPYIAWVFWVAQGVGILVKGPITPLVSGLTILALYAIDRDWRWLSRLKAGRGLAVLAVIVLPWLALITWKSGGIFWQQSVGKDLLGKVGEGQESHWGPPGYYMLTYALYVWPFALLAIDAALKAFNSARGDARLLFCLAWYIPFWVLFEVISTKLPHYMLPAYPALALLIGWSLVQKHAAGPLQPWQSAFWWLAAFGHVVVTLGLCAVAIAAPLYLEGRFAAESIVVSFFVLVAGVFAIPKREEQPLRRVGQAALAAIAAHALIFAALVPSLTTMWMSPRIVEAIEQNKSCDDPVLATAGFHEPSLVFLAGTGTILTGVDGVAKHLLGGGDCALALVPAEFGADLEKTVSVGGKAAEVLTRIDGLNYSSGDRMTLSLYRVAR